MGLLDSLIGAASQAMSNNNGAQGGLSGQGGGIDLGGLLGSLMGNGAVQGGLAGLLEQLQAGGLGEQVKSWISQGSNLPVSGDQIASALGSSGGSLGQLAQALGLSHGDAAEQLAQHLPQLVDHLTPDGQMPAHDSLSDLLGQMMGQTGGNPAR
ncbi:YidB family protein [Burkholderiaceae bacterium UC74_6]